MDNFDLDLGLLPDFKNDKMDILQSSMDESGLIFNVRNTTYGGVLS